MKTFIDIETIPQQPEDEARALIAENIKHPGQMKAADTIAAWHNGDGKYAGEKDALIEKAYRDTSFDGSKGEIISIAWAVEDCGIESVHRELGESEHALISNFFERLRNDLAMRPPYFIGHYISGFDLKFLFHRAVVLRINPGFDLCQWGRHGSQFYDTMVAWAGYGNRISQDDLCKALGIQGKPDDIDGSKVWDFVKAGKVDRVAEYNRDDVEKVRKIYQRMTFGGETKSAVKAA